MSKPTPVETEVGPRIKALRKALGLSQSEFALEVGVKQGQVSRWEAGTDVPSSESFSRLARLASDENDAKYFIDSAIDLFPSLRSAMDAVAQKYDIRPARRYRAEDGEAGSVPVPLLRDAAAAGVPRMIRDAEIAEWLRVPARWITRPEFTRCLRIVGDSMSPVLEDGYIVAIDTSGSEARDLVGRMVAARDPEGGVTVKWLRKVGREYVLVAEHTSRRHNPVILSDAPNWKIIGRVLFWVGGLG